MNNILCKIGLHKWRKVKSTETNMMDIMSKILEARVEYFAKDENVIYKKFGMDNRHALLNYDICNYVCVRPGCNCCDHRIEKKKDKFIKIRNRIVRDEIKKAGKNKLAENIYKGCRGEEKLERPQWPKGPEFIEESEV